MTTWVGNGYIFNNGNNGLTNASAIEWCTRIKAALDGCGLVQTADTGQIVPANAVMPGGTADIGYFIYRFNDSLQGTDPIYIKFMPGRGQTGSGSGQTRFRLQVGQGSNGAGTLTGHVSPIVSTADICSVGSGGVDTGSSIVMEFATHSEGHALLIDRYGQYDYYTYAHVFDISRTRDATGAFDGRGVHLLTATQTAHSMCTVRFAAPSTNYSDNIQYCLVPGLPSSSALLDGSRQLYPHFGNIPDVIQCWSTCTIRQNEVTAMPTKLMLAPHAGVSRQFLCMGKGYEGGINRPAHVTGTADTAYTACFLWED